MTFPAGAESTTFSITPQDDLVAEDDEVVVVKLAYPPLRNPDDSDQSSDDAFLNDADYAAYLNGYEIGLSSTVADDDNATVVSVTTTSASIQESASDSEVFEITRAGDTSQPLTVDYRVAGDAEPGVDYTGLPGYDFSDYEGTGSATIAAGSTSTQITVIATEDALAEGDESIILALSASQDYVVGSGRQASTWIDSWHDVSVVSIQATDPDASETGSDPATFVVSRTGNTSMPMTVYYTVLGSATPGLDYWGLADQEYYYGYSPYQTGSVTILPGRTDAEITLTPYADAEAEGTETVRVTLTQPYYNVFGNYDYFNSGYCDPSFIDYGYYDSAFYDCGYFDHGYYNYGEYGSAYHGYGAFGYNDYMRYYGGSYYEIGSPRDASATITDNETTITILATDASASETGPDPGVFTITRTGDTSQPLTVYYNAYGSAVAGVDYTGIPAAEGGYGYQGDDYGYWDDLYYEYQTRSVTIPAWSESVDITIMPITDAEFEGWENVAVKLTYGDQGYYGYPGYFGYRPPAPSYSIGYPNRAVISIMDSQPEVMIEAIDSEASEEGRDPGVFRVSLGESLSTPLTVCYAVSGEAKPFSDYRQKPGSIYSGSGYAASWFGEVTIPANEVSQDISITPIDDARLEGPETVVFSLLSYSNFASGFVFGGEYLDPWRETISNYTVGEPDSATLTIEDNEIVSVVTIEAVDPGASEPGTDNGVFRVTRQGGDVTQSLTVTYAVSGATNGVDYQTLPLSVQILGNQLFIDPCIANYRRASNGSPAFPGSGPNHLIIGYANINRDIDLIPLDDLFGEGNETVTIELTETPTSPYLLAAPSAATVLIADNEALVSIEATIPDAWEEGSQAGQFTITRIGVSLSGPLTVTLLIAGKAQHDGSDYSETLTTQVTIPAEESFKRVNVTPINDALGEADETVVLTLVDADGYRVLEPRDATVTIHDNEPIVSIAAENDAS